MENTQRVWVMYTITVFSLNFFLTMNGLTTERHFIVWAAKLNQHICVCVCMCVCMCVCAHARMCVNFKGILISKF